MELNSILFPAPPPSYDAETFPGEIIWIPRLERAGPAIPCLYLPFHRGSSKLLIYFHGNAEDVGLAYELMDHMRTTLMVHVLGVEYPGYGIYPGNPSAEAILFDIDNIYTYITQYLNWNSRDTILFGRSIGSGPASWIAANRNPGALLLMSAYTSIRAVVRNVAGRVAQYLVKERFRNIDQMSKVTCPTFIVHGQNDKLIPYSNSQELHGVCAGPCSLILPKDMDHNEFDFFDDLSLPFSGFLMQCGISVYPTETAQFITIPPELYTPESINPEDLSKGRLNKMFRMFT